MNTLPMCHVNLSSACGTQEMLGLHNQVIEISDASLAAFPPRSQLEADMLTLSIELAPAYVCIPAAVLTL